MDYLRLAGSILNRAKLLVPNKVPQPNPEVTRVWAEWLSKNVKSVYPEQMWVDAVDHWAGHHDGEMLSPQALVSALRGTREQWESDPKKREQLEAHRAERQRRKNLELFGSEDGKKEMDGPKPSQSAIEATKKRFGVLNRKTDKRESQRVASNE